MLPPRETRRPRATRLGALAGKALALALTLVGLRLIPVAWCTRQADAWYSGDTVLQRRLARGVEGWVLSRGLSESSFSTGHPIYDGEWLFGTYMMAGMGMGQLAQQDPARREHYLKLMGHCIDRLLSKPVRRFDRVAWGADPIATLSGNQDHAAYLGYLNLLLSLHRSLDQSSRFAALNDRITRSLARRLRRSRIKLLHTYPRQVYPVDNSAVVGSIGLYDRATGADHSELLERWARELRRRYLDPHTGLLIQSVYPESGAMRDAPRGSGTALAVYFLSFSHPELSRQLHRQLRAHLGGTLLGFGMVQEYPAAFAGGRGDIDSGPIVLGYSVSATGFSLAGSRIHGDRDFFQRLMGTVTLFGAPLNRGDRLEMVTGGPLGNAIMLAMLTARPDESPRKEVAR